MLVMITDTILCTQNCKVVAMIHAHDCQFPACASIDFIIILFVLGEFEEVLYTVQCM